MRALAVIAKSFAVVARHDDERAIHLPMRPQPLEHARDLFVRERDLAVVRRARPRRESRRRRVRRVRIVEVNPQEERGWGPGAGGLVPGPFEPGDCAIDHFGRGTLGFEAFAGVWISCDLIVVGVEPLRETEAMVEHERADECCGAVAGFLEQPRDRRMPGVERVDAVFADTVFRRRQASHDGGV